MSTIVSILTFRSMEEAGSYQDHLMNEGYEPEIRRTKEGTLAVITALEAEGPEEVRDVQEELSGLRFDGRDPQVIILGKSTIEEEEAEPGTPKPSHKKVTLTTQREQTLREKEYRKAYRQNPNFKMSQQKYQQGSGGREAQKRYTKTEHGKAARENYSKSEKGMKARAEYQARLKARREEAKKLLDLRRQQQQE